MPHFGEETRQHAAASFAAMKDAALLARRLSARAELMRHMGIAAGGKSGLPREDAARAVVEEWLAAWNGAHRDFAHVRAEMTALALAFVDYVRAPSDAADKAVREAFAFLTEAYDRPGRAIEDDMAWRSERALPWWGRIRPLPAGLAPNPRAETPPTDKPFWE